MITCPWCGTSYAAFQSNCQRCGGPIPPPPEPLPARGVPRAETRLAAPPPPPRSISDSYAWKLLMSDGWAIGAFVFLLLGVIFLITAIPLVLGIVTAFIGIPFAAMGVLFLVAGLLIGNKRFEVARSTVRVLREGTAAKGEIMAVDMNYHVQVNGRNPWTIGYAFEAGGQEYEGKVTTLNPPAPMLQAGDPAYVLYLPDNPASNSLYPHP